MDKEKYKEAVRKAKYVAKKKRLGKGELSNIMKGMMTLEEFMNKNKSDWAR